MTGFLPSGRHRFLGRCALAGLGALALLAGPARAETVSQTFTNTPALPVSKAPNPVTPVFAIITSFTGYTGPFPFRTGAFRVGTPGNYTFTLNSTLANGLYVLNGTFAPSTGTPTTPLSSFIVFSQQLTNTVLPNIALSAGAQYSHLQIFSTGSTPVTLTISGPGCISFTGVCYDNGVDVTSNIVLDGTVADFTAAAGVAGLQSGAISEIGGPRDLVKLGSGTLNLTGNNTYTGVTAVNEGTLLVNGSIATSSGLTVAAGATVGGTGTLPTAVINGTLSPGNSIGTINVAGNLTIAGTGVYLVEVGTSGADRTNVTGTAALAGTLRLVPSGTLPLAFFARYTLISAAGGLSGTFQTVDNQLGALLVQLTYGPNSLDLLLGPQALTPVLNTVPHTGNQRAVALGLDASTAGGANPSAFINLYLQPAGALGAALDQLSGEAHTGTQGLGVLVSGQFLSVMLDQNAFGRTPGGNPALAYAPDALAGLPGVVAATQAADLPAVEVIDTRRFAVWGAAFGSDGRVGGDTGIGAARRHERSTGLAAGVDMRLAPGTVVGFALAGGGADASISGRGSLSADVFQAGLYAMTRLGMLDLRAALAYSHLDIDSTRSIPVLGIPTLTAAYEAEVWSGRIEAAMPLTAFAGLSIAPVAALQAQSVRTDGFTETTPAGPVAAGLTVAGRTQTTSRAELGARFETRFGGPGLDATAFARLAWAHYFERDASINAAFAGLAGSNFSVIGARPDRDSALISAGIDVRLTPQLSLGARFDGELSGKVSRYAGTARIGFEL